MSSIAELLARAEKVLEGVTPEPWVLTLEYPDGYPSVFLQKDKSVDLTIKDMNFIDAARTIVPQLAQALREAHTKWNDVFATYQESLKEKHELMDENATLRTRLETLESDRKVLLYAAEKATERMKAAEAVCEAVQYSGACECVMWAGKEIETWRKLRESEVGGG